tara:strand:- start:1 stop:546 length:546 start_codon:yes stop_codon:yes gene_type:complete
VSVVAPEPPLDTGSAVPEYVIASVPDVVMGLPAMLNTLGTVAATLVTVPAPAGVDQEPSPRQNVLALAEVPELRLVTGRLPVTPVVRGSPVALVSVADAGVPRIAPVPSVATPVTPRVLDNVAAPVTPRVPPTVALPDIALCASTMSVPLDTRRTFLPLGTDTPVCPLTFTVTAKPPVVLL